jgi:hypothetical protein
MLGAFQLMASDEVFQSNEDSMSMFYTNSPSLKNDSGLNIKRFTFVNTTSLLGLVGSYYFVNTAWWADSKKSFHFDGGGSNILEAFNIGTGRDAKYAKEIDKLGHFYSGRIISDLYVRAIRWSGKTEQESLLWGGILGTAVHGFIEVKDGYSPTWGFSMYDWVSGSLGSFYPYFQSKSRFLNALDIKYSYYPRSNFYYDFINRRGNDFFDDYMNATFWFTFNPKRYKPTSSWPKWLGISAGIGVDENLNNYNLRMPGGNADWGKGGYEFYLAPDIDFKGLLPKRPFWQGLGQALNYVKFPTPAIRFSKDSKLMLIHF